MDDTLLLKLVEKAINDKLEQFIKGIGCPKCKAYTTAIKAGYIDEEGGEDGYYEVWRCMLCLTLFKETLVAVKPVRKKDSET